MSSKRNPFNDNVNHLMEKIFSGSEKAYIPEESYQDEAVPKNLRGQGEARTNAEAPPVWHRTAGENAQTEKGAGDFSAAQRTVAEGARSTGGTGTAQEPPLSEFTLQDIRRTTEELRETTKQMQQMTLQMWAEAAQAQNRREDGTGHGNAANAPGARVTAEENILRHDPGAEVRYPGVSKPVHRVFTPQYRVEEVLDDAVPERIRECKQLARSPQGYRMTKEELFYRQGRMMADYEDDCLYPGEFTWYFPTYQAMNAAQLRGYFTWRAQVRQGNVMPTSLSFAFVYVYELLHQIGVETPQEGFERLKSFWESYREYDSQLDRYMQNWLSDYVVYYNLDRELLTQSGDMAFDDALLVFLQSESHADDEYFAAVCALSKYNMEGSKFYKEYPEDVRRVTCGVFRALGAYYARHGKKTLQEKYFGTLTSCAYQMFASAVFYDYKRYADYVYVINDIHRYRCTNGRWVCERYLGGRMKNKDMGFILHAIDVRMRERYEYKAPLKPGGMTKLVMNIIEKEIDKLFEEKKKNAAPVIEIDVTKLSAIRRASELTKERLIVEGAEEDIVAVFPAETKSAGCLGTAQERDSGFSGQMEFLWERSPKPEEEAGIVPEGNVGPTKRAGYALEGSAKPGGESGHVSEKGAEPAGKTGYTPEGGALSAKEQGDADRAALGAACGLNDTERILLRYLLDGTPYQEYLRERHQMLSVVVDAINEKLFDRFGDTVIVFDGDTPEVLEDYAEEARNLAGGGEQAEGLSETGKMGKRQIF